MIRAKYLPKTESPFEELKRLDRKVQNSGMVESLSLGIIGLLIFGIGMCFGLGTLGNSIVAAVIFCVIGTGVMLPAYPVYRKIADKVKKELTPRILELADELSK